MKLLKVFVLALAGAALITYIVTSVVQTRQDTTGIRCENFSGQPVPC